MVQILDNQIQCYINALKSKHHSNNAGNSGIKSDLEQIAFLRSYQDNYRHHNPGQLTPTTTISRKIPSKSIILYLKLLIMPLLTTFLVYIISFVFLLSNIYFDVRQPIYFCIGYILINCAFTNQLNSIDKTSLNF